MADILRLLSDNIKRSIEICRQTALNEAIDFDRVTDLYRRFDRGDENVALQAWTVFILLRWFELTLGGELKAANSG